MLWNYFFFQGLVSNNNIKTSKSAAKGVRVRYYIFCCFSILSSCSLLIEWRRRILCPTSVFLFFLPYFPGLLLLSFINSIQYMAWSAFSAAAMVYPSVRPSVCSSFVAVCIFNEKLNKKKKKRNMKL